MTDSRRTSGNNPSLSQPPHHQVTQGYRSHVLFPVLEYIGTSIRQCQHTLASIDAQTKKLEQNASAVKEVQHELKALLRKEQRTRFSLKNEGFEVS